MHVKGVHHVALPHAVQIWLLSGGGLLQESLRLFVELLELAYLIKLEVVVVLTLLKVLRVLVGVVARVQTLLLRLELDTILLVCLLLLLAKQQVHGHFQLINLIDRDLGLGGS
mgnify:CR=1 FL=1